MTESSLSRLFIVFGAFALATTMFVSMVALFIQLQLGAPASQAGLGLAYFGVLIVILQLFVVGRLVKRLNELRLVPLGLISLALGTGALFFAYGWVATSAAVMLVAIGMATVRPSLVSQTAGPQRQGVALGGAQSLDSLAQIVTTITGGVLVSAFTPGTPGLVCAAIALAAMLYFVGVRRSIARPVVAQPVPAE